MEKNLLKSYILRMNHLLIFYKKFFMKLARCMKNIGYQMKLQK